MSEYRITKKILETTVSIINKHFKVPLVPYKQTITSGGLVPNVGTYYLAWGHGGVKLEIMTKNGADDVSTQGYVSKSELHIWMRAFIKGLVTK